MIVEGSRLLLDWLSGTLTDFASVDQGLNAHLATIARDGSDPVPANIATFADLTRAPVTGRRDTETTYPQVQVMFAGGSQGAQQMNGGWSLGEMRTGVRIVLQNSATDDGLRDLGYYVRAALHSLDRLAQPENAGKRVRGDYYLVPTGEIQISEPFTTREDKEIAIQLTVACGVEDNDPSS